MRNYGRLRIYLAGKIAKRGWRDEVLGHRGGALDDLRAFERDWPIRERAIFGEHDYVGPWFVSDDHGCGHGPNTHGAGASHTECFAAPKRRQIAYRCAEAICKADLVFVYLDALDAHGTLVEIGLALGGQVDVAMAWSPNLDVSSLWFPQQLVCDVIGASRVVPALQTAIAHCRLRAARARSAGDR